MEMKHLQLTEELQQTASDYAGGAMSDDERKQYLNHLENDGCEVCRAEVLEFQAALHALALDLPEQSPSPAAKMRLMAQAEISASGRKTGGDLRRTGGFEWIAWLISAGATAALIVVLILNSNLRKEVNTLGNRVAELEAQMLGQRTTLAALTSPRVRVVDLAGQGATSQAGARIFWRQTDRRWLLYVSDLPAVSQDRAYQLWFVPKAGAPVSAGVFNTSADGSATIDIALPASLGELKAAAVTTEPAGGLPQPTGSFVLLGAL
jgi:anti-sigma-K factor RskA